MTGKIVIKRKVDSSTMKEPLIRLFLLTIACLVALLLTEGVLRIYQMVRANPVWHLADQTTTIPVIPFLESLAVQDPHLGHRLQPLAEVIHTTPEFQVTVRTNRMGLRDREYGPKQPGTFRILLLGDSFTFGWGVALEETFVRRLERLLQADGGNRSYQVINGGIPGYGTAHAVRLLEEIGPSVQPDLVILGFYVWNDLVDSRRLLRVAPESTVDSTILVQTSPRTGDTRASRVTQAVSPTESAPIAEPNRFSYRIPLPFKTWLIEHSLLLSALRDRYHRLLIKLGLRSKPPLPAVALNVGMFIKPLPPEVITEYRIIAYYLNRFVQLSQRLGAQAVLVIIPDFKQFPPYRHWYRLEELFAVSAESLIANLTDPNSRIAEMAQTLGIPVLDLYESFRAAQGALYYHADEHFTPAGHALAAAQIYEFLRKRGLISFAER